MVRLGAEVARGHDMFETFKYDDAMLVACCDVDSKRARRGKKCLSNGIPKDAETQNIKK